MNKRKLLKELGLRRDLKIVDYYMGLLSDKDEIKRIRKDEAMEAKEDDVWVQILLRKPPSNQSYHE